MSLESATFISQLDSTNPVASDQIKQGDDHLRLVKSVLQACFPNADKAFYFPDSVTKTGNYTILAADIGKRLLADASGGAFNLTLPTLAAADDGWSIWIMKSDATTTAVTLVGTVNGVASPTISKQYQAQFVFWSGTAWFSIGALPDPMSFVSKDTGALAGPTLDLYRDSSSPAASDFIGTIDFNGRDTVAGVATNKQLYAQFAAQIADTVSGTEDGIFILRAVIAGVLTDMLQSNATGILVPGTLNATGDFAINTNKFTVAAASGNAAAAGSITATTALSGATAAGAMLASQAEQETGSATNKVVQPGVQQYHPSACKAWAKFSSVASPVIAASYNIASITRNAIGIFVVNFTTAFSSANYCVQVSADRTNATGGTIATYSIVSASQVIVITTDDASAPTSAGANSISIACWGDQ